MNNTNDVDSRIFLIADTHFGDENIRLYEERPFPDTDTMDREIIRRWNSVVGDNDLVYHLGDFCSGGQERCRELLSQLKGRKRLLIGNHDAYLTTQQWRDLGKPLRTRSQQSHIPVRQQPQRMRQCGAHQLYTGFAGNYPE